jgi:hypothetical protein
MTRLTGIAHYDPGDLTVSVNAGMPLAELARILADQNQFLPLAVPFFERATIGGAIAVGLDSPLRHFYGTARDFLIGAEFVDGAGALTKSGGRVVKNVTGYDFHKLLNGSLGSLAVITRLNFRTFPLQQSRRGFVASFENQAAALAFVKALGDSALTPTVVDFVSPEFAELFRRAIADCVASYRPRGLDRLRRIRRIQRRLRPLCSRPGAARANRRSQKRRDYSRLASCGNAGNSARGSGIMSRAAGSNRFPVRCTAFATRRSLESTTKLRILPGRLGRFGAQCLHRLSGDAAPRWDESTLKQVSYFWNSVRSCAERSNSRIDFVLPRRMEA